MSRCLYLDLKPVAVRSVVKGEITGEELTHRSTLEYLLDVMSVVEPKVHQGNILENYSRLREGDDFALEILYQDISGLYQKTILVFEKEGRIREDWHETLPKIGFSR